MDLIDAIEKNDIDNVKELLASGVDVNIVMQRRDLGFYSATILMIACLRGNPAIIDLVLNAGANVNAVDDSGLSVLAYACSENDIVVVEKLLKAGADVNAVSQFGITALKIAKKKNYSDIVKILIDNGANQINIDTM